MSPVADARILRTAVKDRVFAPAYYFHGQNDYLKDEEVRRMVDAAADPSTRDFNVEVVRGAEVDAETLGSTISTPPMMAERRVVVVRDVSALKKDSRAMLDNYLKRPAPDLLLLLVAPAGAKADARLVHATTAVEFDALSGARIPKWIAYYVEHDLKASITDGAITLLQEAVGTDLSQLKIELDKLASFTGGETINEAAVSAVVGIRPGETMGDFLDAIARRDATAALAMLPVVLEQPKSSAVTTVMALTSQTLVIGWAQAARQRGTSASRLSGELYSLLKESGSVYTGRSWGEFVSTCARASDLWAPRVIDDALRALLEADAALKGPRISSDEQLLSNLVLTLCGATTRRRAA
jgi:DNA polymerase-3 subunit delta